MASIVRVIDLYVHLDLGLLSYTGDAFNWGSGQFICAYAQTQVAMLVQGSILDRSVYFRQNRTCNDSPP
jgi:hypothetical protein